MSLPQAPSCPTCGGLDPQVGAALGALALLQARFNRVAVRKHAFGMTVNSGAVRIPYSDNRVGSIIIPSAAVWLGHDSSVTSIAGPYGGLPIAAGGGMVFGPEDGDSPTYLVAAGNGVDVRILELLADPLPAALGG